MAHYAGLSCWASFKVFSLLGKKKKKPPRATMLFLCCWIKHPVLNIFLLRFPQSLWRWRELWSVQTEFHSTCSASCSPKGVSFPLSGVWKLNNPEEKAREPLIYCKNTVSTDMVERQAVYKPNQADRSVLITLRMRWFHGIQHFFHIQ